MPPRKGCGSPGCCKSDFHDGLCSTDDFTGPRRSRAAAELCVEVDEDDALPARQAKGGKRKAPASSDEEAGGSDGSSDSESDAPLSARKPKAAPRPKPTARKPKAAPKAAPKPKPAEEEGEDGEQEGSDGEDDPSVDTKGHTGVYLAEYAKSGRAKCKVCGEVIGLRELRIGIEAEEKSWGVITRWQHVGCTRLPRSVTADALQGYDSLLVPDAAKVDEMLASVGPPAHLAAVDPDEEVRHVAEAWGEAREPPPSLLAPLLRYQKEGLGWMCAQEEGPIKGGVLADEMCVPAATCPPDRRAPTAVTTGVATPAPPADPPPPHPPTPPAAAGAWVRPCRRSR